MPPACKIITNPNVDTITGDDDGGKAPGISYGEEPSENDSGGGDGAPAPQPSAPPADEQLQYEVTQEANMNIEPGGYTNNEAMNNESENGVDLNVDIGASLSPPHIGYRRMRSLDKSKTVMDPQLLKSHVLSNSSISAVSDSRLTLDVNANRLIVFGRDEEADPYVAKAVPKECHVSPDYRLSDITKAEKTCNGTKTGHVMAVGKARQPHARYLAVIYNVYQLHN
ncbi:unnamed protein product [Gongylonema pulchrum]|uniref:PITH domain-containing protein n=1 Tax=Gongylonema pulchrum TaxID=637853 RepID=A0A183DQV3_9BILA|nr:unnamed protein product [Gongylonema pulchrum]